VKNSLSLKQLLRNKEEKIDLLGRGEKKMVKIKILAYFDIEINTDIIR